MIRSYPDRMLHLQNENPRKQDEGIIEYNLRLKRLAEDALLNIVRHVGHRSTNDRFEAIAQLFEVDRHKTNY
jgi:hypothetical protein